MYPTLAQLKAVFRLSPTGPPYQPGSYLIRAFPLVQTGPLLGYWYRSPGTVSAFIPFFHTAFRAVPVPLFCASGTAFRGRKNTRKGVPLLSPFFIPLSDRSRYRFFVRPVPIPGTGPLQSGYRSRYRFFVRPVGLFGTEKLFQNRSRYRFFVPTVGQIEIIGKQFRIKKALFSCLRNTKC